jgi:hypothetical protein
MERGVATLVAMPQCPMMNPASVESALHITHMGATARAHLASGQCGQVLAVVSNAIYLLTASGELLWLASDGAPMHRRCLKVSAPLPRPDQGAPFYVDGHCLEIDPGLAFDTASASLWQPPKVNRSDLIAVTAVAARVRALVPSLDLSRATGFGRFIPEIVGCGPSIEAAIDDLVLTHAKPTVLSVADACLSQDRRQIARCADALIGLGAGLTPSGDDLVGGLLFGARVLLDAYPGSSVSDMAIIGEHYRMRTNQISFTLLDDLANGHAIEPLYHLVNGILMGESLRSIRLAVGRVTRVGHSTGWDMVAGLFTGLLLAHGE